MSEEEKQIMNKMIYCNLVNGEQALKFNQHIKKIQEENKQLHCIIKEVREYITSYESIETIQQFDHNKNNKGLDYSTIDEMTRRHLIVHDKILKILDKENK